MDTMINRVTRAAMLDVEFYKEVEADTTLNQEALVVVILVSLAAGIGSFLSSMIGGSLGSALLSLIVVVIVGVVNYYIWSYVTYFVGTNLFNGIADAGELLRVLGYASIPGVLGVLSFVPCLGGMATLIGAIWALIAGFVAVREALDLDTAKTFLTVAIGWMVVLVIKIAVRLALGVGALGVGALGSLLGSGR